MSAWVCPDRRMTQCRTLLKTLGWMGVPTVLMQIILRVYIDPNVSLDQTLQSVEFFAGDKAYTNAKAKLGYMAVGFEIKDDPTMMDFMSPLGFLYAISLCCQLKPASQSISAPVCSSWVWMSRGSTGRTRYNPLGNRWVQCVRTGNAMVSKSLQLCRRPTGYMGEQ